MQDKTVIEVKTGEIEERKGQRFGEDFTWHRFKALLGRKYEPHKPLEELRDLSNTSDLEMRLDIAGKPVDVALPREMMARLVRYMADKNYPFIEGNFDCLDFTHWMMGVPYKHGDGVDTQKFALEKLENDWSLMPGDVINLSPSSKWGSGLSAEHAVVYIGHGLYISKLGEDHGLSVQNLYQLKEIYGENNLFKQTLRGDVEN